MDYTTSCKHKCKHTWGNWYNMSSTWGAVDLASHCSSCKCYRYWVNKKSKPKVSLRANKHLKKLAKHLFDTSWEVCNNWTDPEYEWESSPEIRNHYYDEAKKLYYMILYTTFEGADDEA